MGRDWMRWGVMGCRTVHLLDSEAGGRRDRQKNGDSPLHEFPDSAAELQQRKPNLHRWGRRILRRIAGEERCAGSLASVLLSSLAVMQDMAIAAVVLLSGLYKESVAI